ncbi:MAG: HPP family protein [Haloarculaceae archaeon]
MRDRLRERYRTGVSRLRRLERREVREFRGWIEHTRNLVHLSIVVFVPLLIAAVTWLSGALDVLPYLLFPPLASGTYTLFAHPESEYASPRRFVAGLTLGALCGWIALQVTSAYLYHVPPSHLTVRPVAAALSVFLTGVVTWLLDVEEASAFSSALLILVISVDPSQSIPLTIVSGLTIVVTPRLAYVGSVLLSTTLVASVFVLWRRQLYERRARYLYQSTSSDDHVLVPMRTESADATAMLAARLAAAHDAGKVVLLGLADEETPADVGGADETVADETVADEPADEVPAEQPPAPALADGRAAAEAASADGDSVVSAPSGADAATSVPTADRLEECARIVETRVGVPCEVIVAAAGDAPAGTVAQVARETNCDLIATPYEERYGSLTPFVRTLFAGEVDVVVHRSADGRTRWRRVMVPVRSAGNLAHAMLDYALRLAGKTGRVSVCHCVQAGRERRRAETMLSDLVEPFVGPIETRVANDVIEHYLTAHAGQYDAVILGASTDRSRASRLVSPPTFERIQTLDCDVMIVDQN